MRKQIINENFKETKLKYFLEFNPYSKKALDMAVDLNKLYEKRKNLLDQNQWFKKRNLEDLLSDYNSLAEKKEGINEHINSLSNLLTNRKSRFQEIKKQIKSKLNPLILISKNQKKLRREKIIVETKITIINLDIAKQKKLQQTNNKELENAQEIISRFKNINLKRNLEVIESLGFQINQLENDLSSLNEKKNKVESKIKPFIEELEKSEKLLSNAKNDLIKATDFKDKLNNSNSYERKIIHNACRNEFADDQPGRVINKNRNLIQKLERDILKLKNRLVSISEKYSKNIESLIIDGNNLSYQNNEFVGIEPLISLTKNINNKYNITVVFDSDIRSILKIDDYGINSRFSKDVKIHIVATNQKADETILDLASNNQSIYVISNDRYIDYLDKEVVTNERFIRHEIIDNRILIHDLDINIEWN
ncbi:hypothetical protein [Leeuwenhoekiella sp.]|uniref:hypothetical protein n=1 Tax=Leeuwenhoekiella sp. TaxID=1977054 RepID=UPI00324232ED